MMRSNSRYISLLTAQYNLLLVQICWSPGETSRQLIFDDDDEEELRHPLQLRMSQEQTAIYYQHLEIKHPEIGGRFSTDDLFLVSAKIIPDSPNHQTKTDRILTDDRVEELRRRKLRIHS
ncbi:hypothetical protein ACHWQZ_G010329 [Mnemiopsis leidyi]